MVKHITALVLFVLFTACGASAEPEKFSFEVGKSYVFVYDCLPQVGCYAEPVTVLAVDSEANRVLTFGGWWVNLAMVRAIKEYVPAAQEPEQEQPESDPSSLRV